MWQENYGGCSPPRHLEKLSLQMKENDFFGSIFRICSGYRHHKEIFFHLNAAIFNGRVQFHQKIANFSLNTGKLKRPGNARNPGRNRLQRCNPGGFRVDPGWKQSVSWEGNKIVKSNTINPPWIHPDPTRLTPANSMSKKIHPVYSHKPSRLLPKNASNPPHR